MLGVNLIKVCLVINTRTKYNIKTFTDWSFEPQGQMTDSCYSINMFSCKQHCYWVLIRLNLMVSGNNNYLIWILCLYVLAYAILILILWENDVVEEQSVVLLFCSNTYRQSRRRKRKNRKERALRRVMHCLLFCLFSLNASRDRGE